MQAFSTQTMIQNKRDERVLI